MISDPARQRGGTPSTDPHCLRLGQHCYLAGWFPAESPASPAAEPPEEQHTVSCTY